jgi:SAM-dependent methyltransferase
MAELAAQIAALLPKVSGNPAAMLHLAGLMRAAGRGDDAVRLCREALEAAGNDPALVVQARQFLTMDVPPWHFLLVRDAARNAAYEAALTRAVRPGTRVLEIGTGTGLLAMMAARAGAAEVITCEMNAAVADAAVEIIARNRLADRVRVIAKHSTALTLEDLGGPADLLVSEIVSNDLLGEGVLAAHVDAVGRLLKPRAPVIPARGRVRVALAHDSRWSEERMESVSGFDLTAFNRLGTPSRNVSVGTRRIELRSQPVDLMSFDFAAASLAPPAARECALVAGDGPINGVAQWIAIDLDAHERYENPPTPGSTSCWAVVFWPLERPIHPPPGTPLGVCGSHDSESLRIWISSKC